MYPAWMILLMGWYPRLAVTDTALMVVNAQNGIEVGAEIHGRYLANANKSIIFVVNQLDHEKVQLG